MSDVRGLKRLVKKLGNYPETLKALNNESKRDYALALLDSIRRHASGRPGPNVITGVYRNSWHVSQTGGGDWVVLTDHPAARRLEKGFFGSDTLGRVYHQPPFPHVHPAVLEVRPKYLEEIRGNIRKAWKEA